MDFLDPGVFASGKQHHGLTRQLLMLHAAVAAVQLLLLIFAALCFGAEPPDFVTRVSYESCPAPTTCVFGTEQGSVTVNIVNLDIPPLDAPCDRARNVAGAAQSQLRSLLQTASTIDLTQVRWTSPSQANARVLADSEDITLTLMRLGLAQYRSDSSRITATTWCR